MLTMQRGWFRFSTYQVLCHNSWIHGASLDIGKMCQYWNSVSGMVLNILNTCCKINKLPLLVQHQPLKIWLRKRFRNRSIIQLQFAWITLYQVFISELRNSWPSTATPLAQLTAQTIRGDTLSNHPPPVLKIFPGLCLCLLELKVAYLTLQSLGPAKTNPMGILCPRHPLVHRADITQVYLTQIQIMCNICHENLQDS